jgi:DNA-directed RNA polymerase
LFSGQIAKEKRYKKKEKHKKRRNAQKDNNINKTMISIDTQLFSFFLLMIEQLKEELSDKCQQDTAYSHLLLEYLLGTRNQDIQ